MANNVTSIYDHFFEMPALVITALLLGKVICFVNGVYRGEMLRNVGVLLYVVSGLGVASSAVERSNDATVRCAAYNAAL